MIKLLMLLARALIWLRYRITTRGMEAACAHRPGQACGTLFLPNHPALIDPVIVTTTLYRYTPVRILGDRLQVERPVIGGVARRMRVIPIDEVSKGGGVEQARDVLSKCVEALRAGDDLLLYPAGRLQRSALEDLGGKSAVHTILQEIPDLRVVLIRTRGLWGSRFGWGRGIAPSVGETLRFGIPRLLMSGVFFAPRRQVELTFEEPADLLRGAARPELNRWLETFYNRGALPNTYVPYTPWEKAATHAIPEPGIGNAADSLPQVPGHIRQAVLAYLEEQLGVKNISEATRITHDLGLDSLAVMGLVLWIRNEYGFVVDNPDTLQTVGDLMLAASGQAAGNAVNTIAAPPPEWSEQRSRLLMAPDFTERTIPENFLWQAARQPNAVVMADQLSGIRRNRDLLTAVAALHGELAALPGANVGVMLPASVGCAVTYLALLFAGKTPAMLNWTTGTRNLESCADLTGLQVILSSRKLILRLREQGVEFGRIEGRLVYLEDIGARLGLWRKLFAAASARFCWAPFRRWAKAAPRQAVILFTSGSESRPKGVPLTHRNMLANLEASFHHFSIDAEHDTLLGMLPPFHSIGMTVLTLPALAGGIHTVFFPNPTDGASLAKTIEVYRPTILCGTPTFVNGILRSSAPGQLESLRLALTGAEKCPDHIRELAARICPGAAICEGYGTTECAPVISATVPEDRAAGTIGKPIPGVEIAVLDYALAARVPEGATGVLVVNGPNVFAGYLNADVKSPFVEFEGRRWYDTGDLVSLDATGHIVFRGRLKRFVKLGGEMVSLPAIEEALWKRCAAPDADGPVLAVAAAGPEEAPELVLLTTLDLERGAVNAMLREEGLSGLYNIRRVEKIEAIPVLGTGKVDYQAIARRLAETQ
jgi:long-chain-fatty-acid--[acyl-carrier-protein] ligase